MLQINHIASFDPSDLLAGLGQRENDHSLRSRATTQCNGIDEFPLLTQEALWLGIDPSPDGDQTSTRNPFLLFVPGRSHQVEFPFEVRIRS